MSYTVSELISYFGGLMGIVLFIVTLSTSQKSNAVKYSLAAFLIVWSIVVLVGTLIYSGKAIYLIHIFRLDSPLHYLMGPTVYFFTLSTLKPEFRFKRIHLLHLLPFLINFIEFLPYYFNTTAFKLSNYENLMAHGSVIMPMHYLLKTFSVLAYFVAQLFLFMKYQINKLQINKSNQYQVSWFILYFGCQFILTFTSLFDHFSGFHLFGDPYRFIIKMTAIFLYCIMIGLLFFPRILYGNAVAAIEIKEKYSHSKLSNTAKETILNNLNIYMKGEDKPFLSEKIAMAEIAKKLNVSTQQISQVINEKTNLNFNDFVNGYRIEEAKLMLISNDYSKLTIDAIAQKSGFHSKSAFYVAFKKHTGNTPKEFIAASEDSHQLN
ncbi:MAG: helix-turn-helix domain-containing protein [Flavobacteriaceae bacterium]|nr:helix-turn-helix domain-containing protein [Flavobacteriaceae bacterium]